MCFARCAFGLVAWLRFVDACFFVNGYSLQTLRNNILLLQCKCGRSKTPWICLTQAGMFVLNWILLVLLLSSSCSQSWPCSVLSTCTPSNPKNRSDTCFSPSIVFPYKLYLYIYIWVKLSNLFCAFRRRFLNIVSSVSLQVPTSEKYSVPSIYSIFHYLFACV
jgi:hypothetical protein